MALVRFAVVGAGGIAQRRSIPQGLVPARNASLAAVYSPTQGEEIARRFDVPAAPSLQALLAMDIDAVYIATPTYLHAEQIVACAQAGKHVLCEKPLALTPAQAEEAVESCDRAGVKLGVGLHMRFQTQHQAARELLHEGRLGAPVFGRAQLSCWYPPIPGAWRQIAERAGGGALADLGCHAIDLLEMFFGRARRVFCTVARRVHRYAVEDTAVTHLEFASGATGVVDAMFCVPDNASLNRLELYGPYGSILAEHTLGQETSGRMMLRVSPQRAKYDSQQARDLREDDARDIKQITADTISPYRLEFEAFAQAILDDQRPPVDGVHALWNQRVLEACYRSAQLRAPVDLP